MAAIRNITGSAGVFTRSRLIIGLLVLILVLVLGMAWQANRSVQAHNDTAIGVLQDYARLAADEYARRAMGAVGYYGYYAAINDLRATAASDPDAITTPSGQTDTPDQGPALYVFSVDLANDRLSISASEELPPPVRAYLIRELGSLATGPLPESGHAIEHIDLSAEQHTFVVSWTKDSRFMFGFEVDRQWLGSVLQQTYDNDALLPASLAGGAVTNDHLFVRMNDSVGQTMFETGMSSDEATLVTNELLEEYGGVFRGHSVSVAIDPELAQTLIIGGLPKSRLPATVVIILLASGLLLAAIRQLQRESAVMQMRSNFVAEVSHELRTPLTQIRMFTESLLFERFRSSEDKKRALSIINRESQRLIHMVENILRFSGNGETRTTLLLKEQELEPILASVVEEFQVLADASDTGVETSIQSSVVANVDADALRQILLNLLDNAIKYGPRGQTVMVELSEQSDKAIIAVEDQGPGVPESERERIWSDYYRLDRERDSAIAGTGIGLAVVGELVGKHNGVIRVEDTERSGARFVIELPQ